MRHVWPSTTLGSMRFEDDEYKAIAVDTALMALMRIYAFDWLLRRRKLDADQRRLVRQFSYVAGSGCLVISPWIWTLS